MSKYSPLRAFLEANDKDRIAMSFDEIEQVLGETLPASKKYPAWWSNNPSNNPMTKEWLAAGFETGAVDVAGETVVFSRSKSTAGVSGFEESPQAEYSDAAVKHPLWGRLKGVIKLAPGVDLTEPPDPDLADYLDRRYGPEARDE
jgi:hypothetical protein